VGPPTQPGRDVERCAAEAAVGKLDRFTRLDADSDPERKVRVGFLLTVVGGKVTEIDFVTDPDKFEKLRLT
jgi:hypothetical protein